MEFSEGVEIVIEKMGSVVNRSPMFRIFLEEMRDMLLFVLFCVFIYFERVDECSSVYRKPKSGKKMEQRARSFKGMW